MKLKLKEDWQSITIGQVKCLYPPGEVTDSNSYYVEIEIRYNGYIDAYPHGSSKYQSFKTIEEAHAYLIESGSESPWEAV